MRKSELLNDLKSYIGKTAVHKNFQVTANAIYFIFKQYAVSIDNREAYVNILKEIKKYLTDDFGWTMIEVHDCFCKLNILLQC